ncbi:unnamed protein product [Allacma fusca]|uniref:Tubulin polyglutamylase TTLL2 n=1 Tax=Allacma fusca TaxID=39272 RepID=A0A8J2PIQ2_9HEXA|nr:unnamed protein product [Allacma fusca]
MCSYYGQVMAKPKAVHQAEIPNKNEIMQRAIWEFFPFVFRINDNQIPGKTTLTILEKVCKERGWKEFGESNGKIIGGNVLGWNLWWRSVVMMHTQTRSLYSWQYTNHIPKAINFCNKEYLASYIRIMEDHFGEVYNFCPKTFTLPKEAEELESEHSFRSEMDLYQRFSHGAKNLLPIGSGDGDNACTNLEISERKTFSPIWICKPVGKSQGKGIVIVKNLTNLPDHPVTIVQEYICKPLLISGYKFDLRLYVAIVSISPLTIYAYREGLTRFATETYDLTDFEKCYSHLTNASLNKLSPGYEIDKEGVGHGCKWTLQKLRKFFRKTDRTDWFLWQRIMSIIVLTILGEVGQQVGIYSTRNNFEFLGYDILIDRHLRPWLLETNLSPGLGGDCEVDEIVKKPMLHDLFDLLGLPDRRPLVSLIPATEVKTEDSVLDIDDNTNTALKITEEATNLVEIGDKQNIPEKTDSERFEEVLNNKINDKISKRPSRIKLVANGKISPSLQKRLLDVAAIYGKKPPKTKEPKLVKETELSQQSADSLSETTTESTARLNFFASTDWQGVMGNKIKNNTSALPHQPGVCLRRRSWYDAPARQGDWIRIFPFDFLSFQMSRGHMSMDLKVIVNHIEKFLRAAENVSSQDPLQTDSYYNSRLREDISWNKNLWLPPD